MQVINDEICWKYTGGWVWAHTVPGVCTGATHAPARAPPHPPTNAHHHPRHANTEYHTLFELFHTRAMMHRQVYTHK